MDMITAYQCDLCKKLYKLMDDAIDCEDSCTRKRKQEEYNKQEEANVIEYVIGQAKFIGRRPLVILLAKNNYWKEAQKVIAESVNYLYNIPHFPSRPLQDNENPYLVALEETRKRILQF